MTYHVTEYDERGEIVAMRRQSGLFPAFTDPRTVSVRCTKGAGAPPVPIDPAGDRLDPRNLRIVDNLP